MITLSFDTHEAMVKWAHRVVYGDPPKAPKPREGSKVWRMLDLLKRVDTADTDALIAVSGGVSHRNAVPLYLRPFVLAGHVERVEQGVYRWVGPAE